MENSNNWEFVSNSHPTGGDKAYQQFKKKKAALRRYHERCSKPTKNVSNNSDGPITESLWFHPERKSPGRPDKILIASNTGEFRRRYNQFLTPEKGGLILGFDAEWVDHANYVRGMERQPHSYPHLNNLTGPLKETAEKGLLSLVQLSTLKGVTLLCRLAMWSHLPPEFVSLLQSRDIIKIGVGIAEDSKKIYANYKVKTRAIVDLRYVVGGHPNFINCRNPRYNLKAIGQRLFNISWNTWMQQSNWNAPILSKAQIEYAALDAQVSIDAFMHVMPIALGFWSTSSLITDSVPGKAETQNETSLTECVDRYLSKDGQTFRASVFVNYFLMSAELEVKNVVTAEQKQCHLRVRPTIYIYGQKGFVTEGVEFPMGFCKKSEANDFEFFYDPTLDRKMKNTELNLEVPTDNSSKREIYFCRYVVPSNDQLLDFRKLGKSLMTVSQIVVEEAKRRSFVQRNFTVSANDLNRRKVSMRALEEGKQTDEDISDASGSEELEKDPDIPVPQFDSGISPQMVFGTYQQPLALPNFDWISAAPYPPYQFLSPVWGEFPSPLQSNFPEFAGHHQDFPHAKSENSFYRQKYN